MVTIIIMAAPKTAAADGVLVGGLLAALRDQVRDAATGAAAENRRSYFGRLLSDRVPFSLKINHCCLNLVFFL